MVARVNLLIPDWCAKTGCLLFLLTMNLPAQRMAPTYSNLQTFLDSCPQNDPYYAVIRRDFQIMRDLAPIGSIACSEPYTKLPVEQVTEELTILQSLRFAYYMDMGKSGYLPWTPLRLYDWIKSRVAGFNIDTRLDPGSVAGSCCFTMSGRMYITLSTISNDLNRMYRQRADGLAAQIALFAHEVRHSEGNDYSHVSCCGVGGGCDQTYDENNLSPYGIQYYLAKLWLNGTINLGYSCDTSTRAQLASAFQGLANVYPSRFCDAKPPTLNLPAAPGGACISACTFTLSDIPSNPMPGNGGLSALQVTPSSTTCGWTADSPDSWIFATSGLNSTGKGVANFGIPANNTGSSRTGRMIIGGLTTPITQVACSGCASAIHIKTVVSGAPFTSAISPGSWVTIYGTDLAGTSREWVASDFAGNKLPLSLDGVTVRIDGQLAAIAYVSQTQINVQSPDDGTTGSVKVEVTNHQSTATSTANMQRYAPAFFIFGTKYVAAVHADGTFVGPAGLLGSSAESRPAHPGEVVMLFGTGFGPTNPPTGAGVLFTGAAPLADPTLLRIRIGGQPASVHFAGLTGAGLYQFNVTIPELPDGDNAILASISNAASQANIFIATQR